MEVHEHLGKILPWRKMSPFSLRVGLRCTFLLAIPATLNFNRKTWSLKLFENIMYGVWSVERLIIMTVSVQFQCNSQRSPSFLFVRLTQLQQQYLIWNLTISTWVAESVSRWCRGLWWFTLLCKSWCIILLIVWWLYIPILSTEFDWYINSLFWSLILLWYEIQLFPIILIFPCLCPVSCINYQDQPWSLFFAKKKSKIHSNHTFRASGKIRLVRTQDLWYQAEHTDHSATRQVILLSCI
jgi:hypothetical protein